MEENRTLVYERMMTGDQASKSRQALAAMLGPVPEYNLACLGMGIGGLGTCSVQSIGYIASADIVYCYPVNIEQYELMKLLNPNVVNVNETMYTKGSPFDSTYQAIIEHVMDTIRDGKKVAYATQGSAAFHCGTAIALHRRAREAGYISTILPGISSFELLSVGLGSHYNIKNIQLYSAVEFASKMITIDPKVPCLLIDLARYVLPAIRENRDKIDSARLQILAEALRSNYPQDHEIRLMYVFTSGDCLEEIVKLTNFEDAVRNFKVVPTVFIGPALRD